MSFGLLAPFWYLVPKGERHVSVLFMSRVSIMIFLFMYLVCLPSVLCEPCDLGLMLVLAYVSWLGYYCHIVLSCACNLCILPHNQKLLSSIVMTESL